MPHQQNGLIVSYSILYQISYSTGTSLNVKCPASHVTFSNITVSGSDLSAIISGLHDIDGLFVLVAAATGAGTGVYSNCTYAPGTSSVGAGSAVATGAGIGGGIGALLVIVAIVMIVLVRRQRKRLNRMQDLIFEKSHEEIVIPGE